MEQTKEKEDTPLTREEVVRLLQQAGRFGKLDLSGRNLEETDLSGLDLRNAKLSGANLSYAKLTGLDLRFANLLRANLSGADLSGVKVTQKQLKEVQSLEGATMPDGSLHL